MRRKGVGMSLAYSIAMGNLVVIMFNLYGMLFTNHLPPPWWVYAIGWLLVIAAFYFVSNSF